MVKTIFNILWIRNFYRSHLITKIIINGKNVVFYYLNAYE